MIFSFNKLGLMFIWQLLNYFTAQTDFAVIVNINRKWLLKNTLGRLAIS